MSAATARFAGIRVERTLLGAGLASGAIAGLAGVSEVAGIQSRLTDGVSSGFAYTGIVVPRSAATRWSAPRSERSSSACERRRGLGEPSPRRPCSTSSRRPSHVDAARLRGRRATCARAILLYEIPRVVMGENRAFVGAEDLLRSHGVEVVNLDSEECVLMQEFIAEHPEVWYEDIGEEP